MSLLRIDFCRASLNWQTHEESYGRWAAIAAIKKLKNRKEEGEVFLLAPKVMAGHVYGRDLLPYDPPYSYQILASKRRHVIYRRGSNLETIGDNQNANATLFKSIVLHMPVQSFELLTISQMTQSGLAQAWPLTAHIILNHDTASIWHLDFPIGHINTHLHGARSRFQIETGPVPIPTAILPRHLWSSLVPHPEIEEFGFALAYIFFNRFDRADLLLLAHVDNDDNRFESRYIGHRLNNIRIKLFGTIHRSD